MAAYTAQEPLSRIPKAETGIQGIDEITYGGLPKERTTLVCGGAGCGKTIFGMQFLLNGILNLQESGVFMSFEESEQDLKENFRGFGADFDELLRDKLLYIDDIKVERAITDISGHFDLGGLFLRLEHAIEAVKAKRVVIDTLETMFSGLEDEAVLRGEIKRLFDWLKEKGVTTVVTGEQGAEQLTRYGLEEYISDCVILLDHRILDQISTRRMRIVKYRGSYHGTNEYPFLIDETGISVLPITSLRLEHEVSSKRIGTGVKALDRMMEGKGFFKGSSILISGTAGTGKTSFASSFASEVCRQGEKCMYFSFEESDSQIIRNMRSIGIELEHPLNEGRLKFYTQRPTMYGLEMNLTMMYKIVEEFKPNAVVMDPITNLTTIGTKLDIRLMLTRFIDYLKSHNITAFFTSLTMHGLSYEGTDVDVSSLIDTWILLKMEETEFICSREQKSAEDLKALQMGIDVEYTDETEGDPIAERVRLFYILKSRGMAHSNKVKRFTISEEGIRF